MYFRNDDDDKRNVDNNRSSLAIEVGTCVRLVNAANYTGEASTNICASSGVVFWNLDRFNDRATSMRVCPVSALGSVNPTPSAPAPAQAPLAGAQFYTLGTFNMLAAARTTVTGRRRPKR